MKDEDYKLCILTTGGTDGHMYRGQIVYDDDEIAILAHHGSDIDDVEASKYVIIEKHHRHNAAFYDNMYVFKLACDQNRYRRCQNFPDTKHPCLAEGEGSYIGPTFTSEELCSLCYFELYVDDYGYDYDYLDAHENEPDGYVPVHCSYIGVVCHELRENPAQVQLCIDAIQDAGDRYAHRARKRITDQKYIGKRFLRFNTYQLVVEHLEVVDYDHDNYRYMCTALGADQSETYIQYWIRGREVQRACDGDNQDKLEQISTAIQHLSKSGGTSNISLSPHDRTL